MKSCTIAHKIIVWLSHRITIYVECDGSRINIQCYIFHHNSCCEWKGNDDKIQTKETMHTQKQSHKPTSKKNENEMKYEAQGT